MSEQKPFAWALMDGNTKVSFWLDIGDAYDITLTETQKFVPLFESEPLAQEVLISLLKDAPPIGNCNTPGYVAWKKRVDKILSTSHNTNQDNRGAV